MGFKEAANFVIEHEGGDRLVEDPKDPGGLTKYGISQRSYPKLDIRGLTRDKAESIYFTDYWTKCKCGAFPPDVGLILFDSAVNQGSTEARILLQKSVGVMTDGVIGPLTIEAVARFHNTTKPHTLATEFVAQRAFHYGLTSKFEYFGLGWMRRLAKVHAIALTL